MARTATRKQATREVLLVMTDEQYRTAGPHLEKLKAAGAPSNTIAILDALALASSMIPKSNRRGDPS